MHGLAANPDRHDSCGGRQLEQEQPDTAAATQHQQPAPARQTQPGQHHPCRSGGQRRGSRLSKRDRRADRRGQAGVDNCELAVSPGAIREMGHRHHPVTGREAADPGPHAVDNPGDVIAQDARHVQPGPAAVRPVTGVDRVDPSRMHGDPHLARAGDRIGSLIQPQLLRAAELADQHRSHQQGSFRWPASAARRSVARAPSRHHDTCPY